MPSKLEITDIARAKRHVLSQQMYRLRRRYKYLIDAGMHDSAARVRDVLVELSGQYDSLGGRPVHKGNVL